MSQSPDYEYPQPDSEKLSEIMDEIGVNERLVRKRRRINELIEDTETVALPLVNCYISMGYRFGSQSEGSTTTGLKSDSDALYVFNTLNVIQSMSESKPDGNNFLMIQNKNIPPGYCHLQYVKPDEPRRSHTVKPDEPRRSHTVKPDETLSESSISYYQKYLVYEHSEQVLLNNSAITDHAEECFKTNQCGPAFSIAATPGFRANDTVFSYYCESTPLQATSWLQELTKCTWPSEDVKQSCRNAGCFVVPVGSKVSKRPELEWRVSTCLQERYLMFSLNITQLRCYVLMKMILKTFIKPYHEDVLSSFMCKNVLFYYISVSSHEWQEGSLLDCLLTCLFMLKECVRQRNCPHFIVPENNLLAGKMTDRERDQLLDIFSSLMKNNAMCLFDISIDSLDVRLRKKYNIPVQDMPDILSAAWISMDTSGYLLTNLAKTQTSLHERILRRYSKFNVSLDEYSSVFYEVYTKIGKYLPTVSSTLGSIMTCLKIEIQTNTPISEIASYLVCGLKSDALSGRLKLASVLYCTGDAEGTENVLKTSLDNYDVSRVQTVCCCHYDSDLPPYFKKEFKKACDNQNELQITGNNLVAYCTRFLPCEINCIPHELRYELWRVCSGKSRRREWTHKARYEDWMDLIVVDSLPYIYYLQYKVYGELQSQRDQQRALNSLSMCIDSMGYELSHKETSLNLLGQSLEQEQRQSEAFGCYISSIKHRPTNNAARLLICLQLFRIWKR